MYKYIQGTAETKGMPGVWDPVDLSALTFAQIFSKYLGAFAELEVVELKRRYSLDLWDLPTELRHTPIKFGDWLVSIGNATIPLQDTIPKKERKYVTYRDIWQAGFQVQGFNRAIAEEQPLLLDQIVDAKISKADVDYKKIDEYALFVVNGLVHFSTYIPTGLIVADAGRTLPKARDNRIGVLNFEQVGKIKRWPITKEMLVPPLDGLPYKETVYIRMPNNVDLQNKVVGIVIGGYLHLLDGAYDQVGTNLLKIHMRDYPLIERYWDLKETTDVSNFKLTQWENRKDKVSYTELSSNENIAALFDMSQSFVVTIDAKDVGVERILVHQAELAGRYMAYEKPKLPLINSQGRLSNYTFYAGKHNWVVRTSDYFLTNRMIHTNEYRNFKAVTGHRYVHRPKEYQPAFWLGIYKVID